MTVKICVHETVPDEKIGFSVIMAKYEGKWIFGRRFDRETWEIPVLCGGKKARQTPEF